MEQTLASITVALLLLGAGIFGMWAIGSLACALTGLDLGRLAKVGLGLLGVIAGGGACALFECRPPAWLMWVVCAICAAGLIFLVRALRSGRTEPGSAPPTP